MRHLTVRNVPADLADRLADEKRIRGGSLNQTVIDLLAQAVGIGRARSNGLAELAGSWSEDELTTFERALVEAEQVDEELWR